MKIALVLNRFYPEVGGAETNLYFQAKELSKRHQVTVFTPRRLPETPKKETLGAFSVRRLLDVRNRLPNIGRDTFMPGIFFRILFGGFDAVMAFPSLNHNNILALIASKIRRIPFILCSFDLLDYAEIQKKTGKRPFWPASRSFTPPTVSARFLLPTPSSIPSPNSRK